MMIAFEARHCARETIESRYPLKKNYEAHADGCQWGEGGRSEGENGLLSCVCTKI